MSNSIKNGKDLNTSQKKIYKVQQAHEKMINIIHHYGNANQNHNEYHYILTRMAKMKETGENVQPLWKTFCVL